MHGTGFFLAIYELCKPSSASAPSLHSAELNVTGGGGGRKAHRDANRSHLKYVIEMESQHCPPAPLHFLSHTPCGADCFTLSPQISAPSLPSSLSTNSLLFPWENKSNQRGPSPSFHLPTCKCSQIVCFPSVTMDERPAARSSLCT